MVGDRESTSVRCSRDRLKITICGNGNNTELFKTPPVNRLYVHAQKWRVSLSWSDTFIFSALSKCRSRFGKKVLGRIGINFSPRHFSRPSMKLTSRVPQILKVDPDKKDLCHCNRIIIIKSKLERRNRSRSSKAPWFLLYMYSIQTIYLSLSHSIIWRDLLVGLACRLYGWNMQTTRLRKADDTLFRDSIT